LVHIGPETRCGCVVAEIHKRTFGHIGQGAAQRQATKEHLCASAQLPILLQGQADGLPAEAYLERAPAAELQQVASQMRGNEGVPVGVI